MDPEKKERAAALRNAAKDGIKKMKALYLPGDVDSVFSDMDACRGPVSYTHLISFPSAVTAGQERISWSDGFVIMRYR